MRVRRGRGRGGAVILGPALHCLALDISTQSLPDPVASTPYLHLHSSTAWILGGGGGGGGPGEVAGDFYGNYKVCCLVKVSMEFRGNFAYIGMVSLDSKRSLKLLVSHENLVEKLQVEPSILFKFPSMIVC